MNLRMSDLQTKKIIQIENGKNMGTIVDAEVREDGTIEFFVIEEGKNFFSFSRENDTRIFWNRIQKIGEDVILVSKE